MSSPGKTSHSLSCVPVGIWAPTQHLPQCFPSSVLSSCPKYMPSPWTAFSGPPLPTKPLLSCVWTTARLFSLRTGVGGEWYSGVAGPCLSLVSEGHAWDTLIPSSRAVPGSSEWVTMVYWMLMEGVLSFAWQFTRHIIFNRHRSILRFNREIIWINFFLNNRHKYLW